MKRAADLILVVAGVLILVVFAVARERASNAVPPSVYSTYDTGAKGYRALYEVLAAQGVDVRRNERALGLLDGGVKTLVESSVTPELDAGARFAGLAHPLTAQDAGVLHKFLDDGGRLVVLDDAIGGEEDARIGLPGAHAVDDVAGADAMAATADTAGVRRVAGRIAALFPLTIPKATPLLGARGGIVALEYPFGKGDVVAIAAPGLFSNATIAKADNALFAYDLLSGRGPVVFDERPHGYAIDKSFWEALPEPVRWAFWIVCAIVLLALTGANVRFAPPVPLEPPDERDSSAYVRAMANLMRRARSARAAIATFADDAARRVRRHPDLSPENAAIVAEIERLHAATYPGDAALVRAAVLDGRLRKDLS